MRNLSVTLGVAAAAAALALALALAPARDFALDVEQSETIEKSFTLDAGARKKLKIDNLDGAVTITAHNRPSVEVNVRRTVNAESKEKIETARQEVRLELSLVGNEVTAVVDAPWRCRDGINDRGWRFYGYRVKHDFAVKAPADTDIWVRTINRGEINVTGIAGAFDVKNINGGVEMTDIAGSGRVYAVNGKVKVLFARNPGAESYFGSLNGAVDVYFRPGLQADLWFKTFNGAVYTDFPVTYLEARQVQPERREDGKFVFRTNQFSGARVGAGGPELKFDGFNGAIHIRERVQ
jgi:hypothetical protein